MRYSLKKVYNNGEIHVKRICFKSFDSLDRAIKVAEALHEANEPRRDRSWQYFQVYGIRKSEPVYRTSIKKSY